MPMPIMPTDLEKNPPAVEDNTEELVLKEVETPEVTPEDPWRVDVDAVYSRILADVEAQFIKSAELQGEIQKQMRSFFSANVVVRGKTEDKPKTDLEGRLSNIQKKMNEKI